VRENVKRGFAEAGTKKPGAGEATGLLKGMGVDLDFELSAVDRIGTQFFLDAEELVVFCDTVRNGLREPVLIWPQFVATAISAMVASSVSPERCDSTEV
jgi:hypothetical protein